MKKFLSVTIFLLFALPFASNGQFGIGYNTDGNTICLSTNPLNKLYGEFRVNTKSYNQSSWSYNDIGITQAYLLVTIISSDKVSLYSGGGLGMNLLSEGADKWLSVNVPVGIKLNPFSTLPGLFLIGEYDPMVVTSEGIPVIHCMSLGFRYVFHKKD